MDSMAPNGHPFRGRDGAEFGGGELGGPGGGRSGELPALPVTWRPHRTRTIIYTVAAVLAGSMTAIAATLPSDGGEPWPLPDRIAFACIGFAGAVVLMVLARPKAVADAEGLTVVNMLRTHRLEWAQIVTVNLRSGDPWVLLDLDDGTTLSVMGIQPADGLNAARSAVAELRALVDYYSYN
ncbi:PH domain-containing protein [Actinospica sp. MGRD01-02]|uniref:PH domain-containing protein n=1 Tax=Actinospica acidithermotolerans TaxID=2828514 RepID=A0A941EEC1_9ACTN|nr:PH domain-containing protein [Actinospica acidithermotolerans]MBR7827499.1 PH domain-containing protein [Actinospica acidithermotolerans]